MNSAFATYLRDHRHNSCDSQQKSPCQPDSWENADTLDQDACQSQSNRAHSTGKETTGARLLEMCFQQIRYGILELNNGYLESTLISGLPQYFANLCALLLFTAEHEGFVAYHLEQFPLSTIN